MGNSKKQKITSSEYDLLTNKNNYNFDKGRSKRLKVGLNKRLRRIFKITTDMYFDEDGG